MKYLKKCIIVASLLVTACASPYAPKTVDKHVNEKNCEALDKEMGMLQRNIHKYEDERGFQLGYVFILPAFISEMRYSDAIKASQNRMGYIASVMEIKGCFGGLGY